MYKSLFSFLFAIVIVQAPPGASTPKSGPPSRQVASKPVKSAVSNEVVEKAVGMTKDDFERMGLASVTPRQFAQLVLWIQAQQKTADNAKSPVVSYMCSVWNILTDPARLDKVRVFLNVKEDEPAEIVSGVRERLRSMSGVEVVFSEENADVAATLIAEQIQSMSGYPRGYSLSIVTSEPCESKIGTSRYPFKKLNNIYLQITKNAQDAVETAVSTLEANDIEDERKKHAAIKAYIEQEQGSKPQP